MNEAEDAVADGEEHGSSYQVFAVNISWNPEPVHSRRKASAEDLPAQCAFSIPENVLNQASKKKNNFNDVIESYSYKYLAQKFDHEPWHCQIYLPLEDSKPAEA